MAETKNEVKKTEVEKTEKKKAEKMVTIKLPRERKDRESEFVSINEKTYQIKIGVAVDVPESVAEAFHNAELMKEEAYEFDSSVKK